MLTKITLLFLIFGLASSATTNLYEGHPEIEFLNRDNFGKVRQGNWLVEFYADWCRYSKTLVPKYIAIAKRLNGVLKIGAINAAIHKTFIPIRSVPQIKLFLNGTHIDYKGAKTVDGIIKFVQKKLNTNK
jgi:thioredoxin-like negative regulator of GroEL